MSAFGQKAVIRFRQLSDCVTITRAHKNSRAPNAKIVEATARSSMPLDIPENGVLKKSKGHIAYEPPTDRNANTAKKSGPAIDFTPRSSIQNPSLVVVKESNVA
jgi:hypothetical protein